MELVKSSRKAGSFQAQPRPWWSEKAPSHLDPDFLCNGGRDRTVSGAHRLCDRNLLMWPNQEQNQGKVTGAPGLPLAPRLQAEENLVSLCGPLSL